jgi:DNA-binding LacI/PurR family transcriptional regulator
VVLFNRVMAGPASGAVSSVRSDNVAGGRAIAHFLADGGHRRIAFIAGQEAASTNLEREQGLRDGLAERGLRIWARGVGHYDPERARAAALALFDTAERPDAVFVASDNMAFPVMDVLRHRLGLRVPEDVSVVGFDDVPQAAWDSYRLTTFEQPVPAMVEAAVALLQKALGDGTQTAPGNVVVPGRLIVRDSARRPPTVPASPGQAPHPPT